MTCRKYTRDAASIGVDLKPGEMAMRCNIICIEGDDIKNHSAGHITTEEADVLVKYLQEHLGSERVRFHTGVQYRHLLVIKGGDKRIDCTPPHDVPLKPYRPLLVKPMPGTEGITVPEGQADLTPQQTADLINDLIMRSQELLKEHPVNRKRAAEGKDPANSIWPWSPGYRPQMEKEYAYWMDGVDALQPGQANKRVVKLEDGALLNRYWDDRDTPRPESWLDDVKTAKSNPNRPATEIYRDLRSAAASGWDFSSRWMDDPQKLGTIRTTSIVPVDLNALMFKMEKLLARASQEDGDTASASKYDALASARQKAMESHLWNDKEGWYADYDLKTRKVRNQLTAAALFPLYVKAASQDRADKVAAAASSRLLKPGGISTTTINSGQQWDAPNGWAPLQWVAVEGLQNYGQQKVAMDVTWRFLKNVQHTYDREKKLVEKYDVSSTGTGGGGGEYPLQDGFGWSNGVTLRMLDMVCPKEKPCDTVPENQPAANDDVAPAKQAAQ